MREIEIMYKVAIVEDEPLSRRGIAARLREHRDITLIGECSDGEEAVEILPVLKPDILFLDVQLPARSGIDVLKSIPRDIPPAVIFLTAFSRYAIDAFEFHAVDYLLKPIDDERFIYALNKAKRQVLLPASNEADSLQRSTRCFAIRERHKIIFVDAPTIDWVEAVGDYCALHVGTRTHLLRESITSFLSELDPNRFIRVHRSVIVQIDRIVYAEPLPNRDCRITLRSGKRLRVSRTFSSALWDTFRNPMVRPSTRSLL